MTSTRVRLLASGCGDLPSICVAWGLRQDEVPVEFLGRRLAAPPAVSMPALQRRADHLRAVLGAGGGVAVASGFAYAVRGAWYRTGYAWGVFAAALAAALLVYGWRRAATLGRPRAARWLMAVPAPLAALVVLAWLGEPDLGHARASVRAGRLADAQAELEALGNDTDLDLVDAYADLRLAQLRQQTSSGAARALLDQLPPGSPQQVAGVDLVDAMLVPESRAFAERGNLVQAEALLAQVSDHGHEAAPVRALQDQLDVAVGQQCVTRSDWACATARAARLQPRNAPAATALVDDVLAALQRELTRARENVGAATTKADRLAMLVNATRLLETIEQVDGHTTPSPDLSALRDDLAKAQAAVDAEAARAARREAAAEARAAREEERQSRRTCCRVCTRGCACGDSCISCSKTCRKGPGCAC